LRLIIGLTTRPIPDDQGGNLDCYNDALAPLPDDQKRWFTMNWLFAECYLYVHLCQALTSLSYRLLRSYFASTNHWNEYDPFFESKAETYRSSSGAIIRESVELSSSYQKLRYLRFGKGHQQAREDRWLGRMLSGFRVGPRNCFPVSSPLTVPNVLTCQGDGSSRPLG